MAFKFNFDLSKSKQRTPDFNPLSNYFRLGTNQPENPIDFNTISENNPSPYSTPVRETAYDRFLKTQDEMPIYGDKQYQRGKWGKLGALLAGATVGGLTGDPNAGMQLSDTILNKPFEDAYSRWAQRFKADKESAVEERQRNKEAADAELQKSQTRWYDAQAGEKEETRGLNRVEKIARIRQTLASSGLDEAKTEQVIRDLNNPELLFQRSNKGSIIGIDKRSGEIKIEHQGVNLSDEELKALDTKNELKLVGARGGEARKTLSTQIGGFKELADDRFKKNLIMKGIDFEADKRLQDDRLKAKGATSTDAKTKLTNPQFQRKFNEQVRFLEQNPENKQKIRELLGRDPKGNVFMLDPNDDETIDLFNRIMGTMEEP